MTKEGFQRLLSEYPGLTNLRVDIGVPVGAGDEGCLVPCKASWQLDGVSDSLECEKLEDADYRIPVRKNKAMEWMQFKVKPRANY